MNARQLKYQWGRLFSGAGDLTYAGATGYIGYKTATAFAAGAINPVAGALSAMLIAYMGFVGYHGVKNRIKLREKKREVEANPGEYYFAESEKIIISDRQGLEMLLEKTAQKEWREWGTLLNAHEEGSRAVVHKIAPLGTAEEKDLIVSASIPGIMLWRFGAAADEFEGFHHYHPWGGSSNYSVNTNDRNRFEGWINLLTFNVRSMPEIIGYNIRHTYIPEKKEDKSVLVRATPSDIMKYLAK